MPSVSEQSPDVVITNRLAIDGASLPTEVEWKRDSSIRRLTVSNLDEDFNLDINLNFSKNINCNNFHIQGITQVKLQKAPKLLLDSYNLFLDSYVSL